MVAVTALQHSSSHWTEMTQGILMSEAENLNGATTTNMLNSYQSVIYIWHLWNYLVKQVISCHLRIRGLVSAYIINIISTFPFSCFSNPCQAGSLLRHSVITQFADTFASFEPIFHEIISALMTNTFLPVVDILISCNSYRLAAPLDSTVGIMQCR